MDLTDYAQERVEQLLEESLQYRKPILPYSCEMCRISIPISAKIKRWCLECAEEQLRK